MSSSSVKYASYFSAFLIIAILGLPVWWIGSIFYVMHQIHQHEKIMQEPRLQELAARTLALFAQSDQALFPDYFDSNWLPPELREIGRYGNHLDRGQGFLQADRASFGWGGGFYHYGYDLRRDPISIKIRFTYQAGFCLRSIDGELGF